MLLRTIRSVRAADDSDKEVKLKELEALVSGIEVIDPHKEAQELKMRLNHRRVFEVSIHAQPTFKCFSEVMRNASERNVRIVHLSGHCKSQWGFFWLKEDAKEYENIPTEKFIGLFETEVYGVYRRGTIECVVLNACFTEDLGKKLRFAGVPHVVCWQSEVYDHTASQFTMDFYASLEENNCYKTAFCHAVQRIKNRRMRAFGESAARAMVSYQDDPHLASGAVDYVCMLSKDGDLFPKTGHIRGRGLDVDVDLDVEEQQRQRHTQQQQQHPVVPELEFDPFSEQELSAMNKPVPKIKTIQRMSKIGGGAFGTTYRKRVRDGAVNSVVSRFAVKVISAERMEDMHIEVDDVRREAATLGMLRHRYVIRYFGLIETDEEVALVMELAEGGSLADFITITKTSVSGQGVKMGEVLEMTGQLASALDYIHGQGIVHRDIKADNILLAHTNGAGPLCVKLADFGMAAVLATVAGSNLLSKVGTPPYFSPERGKDMAYGAMDDMWALGCVLIELVTLTRLQRGLWNDETEVVEWRNHLLGEVKLRDESVGKLVEGLLQVDKSSRLSALGLKAACSALLPTHTTLHGGAGQSVSTGHSGL
jgi:tRNA A-37 threonylcarbamoyl transferase component Bud32